MKKEPPEHGLTRYKRWGCKCSICRLANTEAMRAYRNGGERGRIQHGTRGCYNNGCRQLECIKANRDYQREWMRLRRAGIPWIDPLIEEALK